MPSLCGLSRGWSKTAHTAWGWGLGVEPWAGAPFAQPVGSPEGCCARRALAQGSVGGGSSWVSITSQRHGP